MKQFLTILLGVVSVVSFGQNISNKEVSTETAVNKKMAKQSIQNAFTGATVSVYQDNAETKIKDLYSYLQLLSSKESEAFKLEVVGNIKTLFGTTSVAMDNIVTESNSKITLDALLQELKTSKHTIEFLEIEKKNIQENSFVFGYSVLVNAKKIHVQQQVFFYPIQKQFGNKTKEVWVYTLGPLMK